MKKYRVVKSYYRKGLVIPVGTIISVLDSLKMKDVDRTALSLGALEEVKAWEPKEGELVYKVAAGGVWGFGYNSSSHKSWLGQGLLYPTKEQAEGCLRRMLEAARKYMDESSNGATANIDLMRKYREKSNAQQALKHAQEAFGEMEV